jgi:hypothetical protein
MHTIVGLPAFSFEQDEYLYADVVLAGLLWGSWQRLERDVGSAAAAELAGERVTDRAVTEAMISFRRRRRLISREDLDGWLHARALSAEELRAHLRRMLLPRGHEPLASEELVGMMRCAATCSGTLAELAGELAQAAAAARALAELSSGPGDGNRRRNEDGDGGGRGEAGPAGESRRTEQKLIGRATAACGLSALDRDQLARHCARVGVLDRARARFDAEAFGEQDIAQRIAARHADWQRVRWQEVSFASEPAAREALLCVREDGMTLSDAAALANVEIVSRSERLAGLARERAAILLAGDAGTISGPHTGRDGFELVNVIERTSPTPDDPECRELARSELVGEALARGAAGRVKWHGGL